MKHSLLRTLLRTPVLPETITRPSKNPSKKHLFQKNLLRTLPRSALLHDPLGAHPRFGLLLQNIQWTVVLHLVLVPVTIAVTALYHEENSLKHMVLEVTFAVSVCLACAMVEGSTRASIMANLQAQSAKALESAAESVLSSVCDALSAPNANPNL